MKLQHIPSVNINSDLTVVNAARVSFSKVAHELTKADIGLISYLAKHNHWTPFAHPAEVFIVNLKPLEVLKIYENCGPGLTLVNLYSCKYFIKGTLEAWSRDLKYLPQIYHKAISRVLLKNYSQSFKERRQGLLMDLPCSFMQCLHVPKVTEEFLSKHGLTKGERKKLCGLTTVSFRVKAPLFVARQLGKHQVNLVWNEVSRRYVSYTPEFFKLHEDLRATPEPDVHTGKVNNKQGSSKTKVINSFKTSLIIKGYHWLTLKLYESLLKAGVASEVARGILPQTLMTEWIWTGSLIEWLRVYNLRIAEDTQAETREIAKKLDSELTGLYPNIWKELKDDGASKAILI